MFIHLFPHANTHSTLLIRPCPPPLSASFSSTQTHASTHSLMQICQPLAGNWTFAHAPWAYDKSGTHTSKQSASIFTALHAFMGRIMQICFLLACQQWPWHTILSWHTMAYRNRMSCGGNILNIVACWQIDKQPNQIYNLNIQKNVLFPFWEKQKNMLNIFCWKSKCSDVCSRPRQSAAAAALILVCIINRACVSKKNSHMFSEHSVWSLMLSMWCVLHIQRHKLTATEQDLVNFNGFPGL